MSTCYDKLSQAEITRNVHGPMYCYEYSSLSRGILSAKYGLSDVNELHCQETPITREEVT